MDNKAPSAKSQPSLLEVHESANFNTLYKLQSICTKKYFSDFSHMDDHNTSRTALHINFTHFCFHPQMGLIIMGSNTDSIFAILSKI